MTRDNEEAAVEAARHREIQSGEGRRKLRGEYGE